MSKCARCGIDGKDHERICRNEDIAYHSAEILAARCKMKDDEIATLTTKIKQLEANRERLAEALEKIAGGKFTSSSDLIGASWVELRIVQIAREALATYTDGEGVEHKTDCPCSDCFLVRSAREFAKKEKGVE